jgi:hypothetical protein
MCRKRGKNIIFRRGGNKYRFRTEISGLEKTRVFLKKTSPVGFFGFFWVFLGFIGFFWVLLGFLNLVSVT